MEIVIGIIIVCIAIWGFNRISHASEGNSDSNEGLSAIFAYIVVVGILLGLICILFK